MGDHYPTRIIGSQYLLRKYSCLLVVLMLFCLVRFYQYSSRPFNTAPIHNMHALDEDILTHDLLYGLYYLHSQPPLFNLMLGLGLKVLPEERFSEGFAALYFLFGLGLFGLCERLMSLLGIHWGLRIVLLAALLFHDPLLAAERYLIYTHPLAFLIVLGIYAAGKWILTERFAWLGVSLCSLVSIVLMRSFFHLVLWMLPMLMVIYLISFQGRHSFKKREILAGVFALLFGALFYAKNLMVAGEFTSSSWFGMNFAAMTAYMDADRIQALLDEKQITPLVNIKRFSPPQTYIDYFGAAPRTGIEALDATTKTTGKPNFNNYILIHASQEYARNTLTLITDSPWNYLKAVFNEVLIYFSQTPGMIFSPGSPWRPALDLWQRPLQWVFIRIWVLPIVACAGYIWILIFQIKEAARLRSQMPSNPGIRAATMVQLLLAYNLVYVLVIAGLFELGEGCFMRIPIDPLILIGGASLLTHLLTSWRIFFINAFSDSMIYYVRNKRGFDI